MKVEMALPLPNDRVRVAWGLGSVTGRVLESYAGIRPRVVVEIDAQELGDEAVSVTVPLGAVEPLARSTSSWAQGMRYERAIADALARSLENLRGVQLNAELPDGEVDILAELGDGRRMLIEVKAHTPNAVNLKRLMSRFRRLAAAEGAYGLIVVPEEPDPAVSSQANDVLVVAWRSEEDDARLAAAVRKLLDLP